MSVEAPVRRPATGPGPADGGSGARRRRRETATSYAMLAPALVLFGVFLLYPLLRAFQTSLTDSSGIAPGEFVGLDNYVTMAGDPTFWRAAFNTLLLAAVSVPLALALGLGMALLLQGPLFGRGLFRALFLAPVVVSGVVVAMAGRWIFDENVGVVNQGLEALGLSAVAWQSGGVPAMVSVLLMLTWSRTGLAAVIYLAGLQGVSPDLNEAAELDGTSWWQRLRLVVMPQLRPTTFFLTVILVIETFHVFDLVYVMTGGGPGNATELLVTYAYAEGFDARREGYGNALGVVVFLVVLVATALWWRAQRGAEEDA